jgi:membrane-associated phospholipid phosphatase
MNKRISVIVSAIFNPFFLPLAAFGLIILPDITLSAKEKMIFMLVTAICSSLLMFAYVLRLTHQKRVDSIDIDKREQRIHPLMLAAIANAVGFIILHILNASDLVRGLMFCYATNTLIADLITRWWKISIHAMGISGPLVALNFLYGPAIIPFYLLIPIVAASRVVLKKHTTGQVVAGALLGLGLTALQIHFLFLH